MVKTAQFEDKIDHKKNKLGNWYPLNNCNVFASLVLNV